MTTLATLPSYGETDPEGPMGGDGASEPTDGAAGLNLSTKLTPRLETFDSAAPVNLPTPKQKKVRRKTKARGGKLQGSSHDQRATSVTATPAHATVIPVTPQFPTSQTPATDLAAMADDGNAEDVITPVAAAPYCRLTPLPADWGSRSKSVKKRWMQTNL